jgi:transcriptional regulator with XRE-family HTH domain
LIIHLKWQIYGGWKAVKDIGKRIRDLRMAMKLTQSQFAELVGLSEDSIGKVERGISVPTIETLMKMAEGLKVTLAELLGEPQQKAEGKNKILNDFIKYLKTKPSDDIRLIHEVAIKILERRKK